MSADTSVVECLECDEIAAGDDALGWAIEHTQTTGHPTSARGVSI